MVQGLGIRATARVFEVAPNTVLHWLAEAAEQLPAFAAYFLCDVHVNQVQLDELYAVLREIPLACGALELAPGCVPLFLTDGLKDYGTALLVHFGQWMHPPQRQAKGPIPKPRWMPLPQLLYAQVVKSYRRQRLVGVKHRVVFGTFERVQQVLSACGWKINTAFVEVRPVGRKRTEVLGQTAQPKAV
jgi:hypothetical protein